jgi:hypothetical protein
VLEIVDREKLLNGPKEPTDENLRYPVIGCVDFPEDVGAHTAFPMLQVRLPEFAQQKNGKVRDFVAVVGETVANEYTSRSRPTTSRWTTAGRHRSSLEIDTGDSDASGIEHRRGNTSLIDFR